MREGQANWTLRNLAFDDVAWLKHKLNRNGAVVEAAIWKGAWITDALVPEFHDEAVYNKRAVIQACGLVLCRARWRNAWGKSVCCAAARNK